MPPELPCPVCAAAGPHRRHGAREMMFGTREPFTYAECSACGLLWLLDVPEDMSPHYPPNYYAFAESHAAPVSRFTRWHRGRRTRRLLGGTHPLDRLLLRLFPFRVAGLTWLRRSGVRLTSRILDVGCGQGHRVRGLSEAGFISVTGVDPFIDADIVYPHGATVRKQVLADLDETYDFIMCHHAFEHMAEPEKTLGEMADRLAPGGTLLIRIPVADSWAWEEYGTDWLQLDAPRHLFLHTRAGMKILGERVGLDLVRVDDDATPASLVHSEMYRRDVSFTEYNALVRTSGAPPFSGAEVEAFRAQAAELNRTGRGDQAAFYFEHR